MTSDAKPISAPPADKQIIDHEGKRYTTVKEGLAHILVPVASQDSKATEAGDQVQQVFYNPIQQFNRDLTVLAIKAYGKTRVERKEAASQSWREKLAEKKKRKRERQGQQEGDPPTKAQKVSDEGAKHPAKADSAPTTADTETAEGADPAPAAAPVDNQSDIKNVSAGTESRQQPAGPSFTILDALSASGLRALRYAHEIPFVTSVTANDIGKLAADAIKLNVEHNGLQSKIKVTHDDALAHMYELIIEELRRANVHGKEAKGSSSSKKYDVVDLDPYGTAAPFFDAAVQSVRDDGGLLCVTCTDSGVWASNGYPEKCYSLYGGVPVKGYFSHEAGIRIILHGIETAAARYGLAIEPLLSLSIDFYIRVFVKVKKSAADVKFQGGKNMVVFNCDSGCGAWETQLLMKNKAAPNKKGTGFFYKHGMAAAPTTDSVCAHCGSTMHLAGPMYAGRIHSPTFVESILAELSGVSTEVYGTTARIRGMLTTALEEILTPREDLEAAQQNDEDRVGSVVEGEKGHQSLEKGNSSRQTDLAATDPYPFFFHPSLLAKTVHCATPSEAAFRGALIGMGYRSTRSHCKPGSIKTDAPWSAVWQIMREWVRQKAPVKEQNIKPGSAGYRLLGLNKQIEEENGEGAGERPEGDVEKKPEVVFDEALGRQQTNREKLVRYQVNPREFWGPMSRAKGK
ncbi:N2,N2-dimethylguanosine tRNA methyltransferase [Thozetella sp. PMI_491]|nr:N2,N2-dimethylguanosine tRNA methyltransferase [Thozetella sp. PMI_491]